MSSFDKTGGKNLDEILASIRKTLADESTPPPPSPQDMRSVMPDAVVQNGVAAKSDKIDDDLADLLAGGLDDPTPATKEIGRGTTAEEKDPLWFLRPSAGHEPQALPLPGDGTASEVSTSLEGAAIVSSERSSLAPVFVADKAEAMDAQPPANGTRPSAVQDRPGAPPAEARTVSDAPPTAKGKGSPGNAMAGSGGGVDATGSSPNPPSAAPLSAGGGAATATKPADAQAKAKSEPQPALGTVAEAAKSMAGPSSAAPAGRPTAAPVKPETSQSEGKPAPSAAAQWTATAAASLRGLAGSQAAAAIRPAAVQPATFNGAPGASPQRAPVVTPAAAANLVPPSQTQALEQVIEQLLEPLLRRWVEVNLPRLVDAAIRAEVARALEKKPEVGRQTERKA